MEMDWYTPGLLVIYIPRDRLHNLRRRASIEIFKSLKFYLVIYENSNPRALIVT